MLIKSHFAKLIDNRRAKKLAKLNQVLKAIGCAEIDKLPKP